MAGCPAGMHRPPGLPAGDPARIERRTVTNEVNRNGDPVGGPAYGTWSISVDLCVTDYTVTETQRRPCTYTVEGVSVTGYEIWTRRKSITASGESGTWSMMFTTCQVGPIARAPPPSGTPEALPTPTIIFPTWTETEPRSCPYCFEGTASRSRIHTDRHTRFPWDSAPTIQTDVQVTQWVTDNSRCRRIADTVWTQVRTEGRTLGCGAGFSGTYTQQRSATDRYVQPCGGTVSVTRAASSTAWVTVSNGCVAIPPPPPPPDDPDDGGHDDGGRDDGGGDEGGSGGDGEGDGDDGDGGQEGGLGDGEDAAAGGDGLGSETADESDDGVGSFGDDDSGGDGGGGDGGGDD